MLSFVCTGRPNRSNCGSSFSFVCVFSIELSAEVDFVGASVSCLRSVERSCFFVFFLFFFTFAPDVVFLPNPPPANAAASIDDIWRCAAHNWSVSIDME